MPHAGHAVVHLGNVWLVAATLAHTVMGDTRGVLAQPYVVIVSEKGDLTALGPEHPDYASSLLAPGFVCTVSQEPDPVRLAGRIRDAVIGRARLTEVA